MSDASENKGKRVKIQGRIGPIRDHGKLIFFELYDTEALIQCIVKNDSDIFKDAQGLSREDVVSLEGEIKDRGDNKGEGVNGDCEFLVEKIDILGKAQELPFDMDSDLNIDVKLDYRPLTLRREKEKKLFLLQAKIIDSFRSFFNESGFVEIQTPKIVGEDAEGGAGAFKVEYFKDTAYLATSPQLYKQIMVGVFDKVFCIGSVFRAEKHSTTRHINEYVSLDAEMGYIENHRGCYEGFR